MNKITALVGIASGLAGAGFAYTFKVKATTDFSGETKYFEPNSNPLCPKIKISENLKKKCKNAIEKSQELAKRFKDEVGIPGLVVGVSVDGNIIWEEGFGFANLETRTPCHANTSMRIASISKPITMALVAKLYEANKIDFDKSIHDYVSYFPKKKIDGKNVDITVAQLASHTGGIRHYTKKGEEKKGKDKNSEKEFYFKERIDSVEKAVEMFKDDELLFEPGTSFEYTTHGYTLLSAVVEKAEEKPFTEQIQHFFSTLGLENTQLDKISKIIYGRSSYYDKNKQGKIKNAELADTSYKWAGGGFISTVGDLLKFGNIMLYSYQQQESDKPGYLKKATVEKLWTPVKNTSMKWGENSGYGLGWTIVPKLDEVGGGFGSQKFYVGHSGGAVGASSVLVILPKENNFNKDKYVENVKPPQGVVVAILANLEDVSCKALGKNIAEEFYSI